MNQRSLLPLTVALAAEFSGQLAHAQVAPRLADGSVRNVAPRPSNVADGRSNTLLVGETVPNSLLTRASVSGNITQTASQTSQTQVNQTVSIGGASQLTGATGNIRTQGTLVGDLVQSRTGGPNGFSEAQRLSIGGVVGDVTAQNVDANGSVLTSVSQLGNTSSGGQGRQTVDVGGVGNGRGGSITTQGLVTGGGVVQNSRNALQQSLSVGSVTSSTLQAAQTSGLVSGQVNQSSSAIGSGESFAQTIGVGEIQFSQAQFVSTSGTVSGSLSQTQSGTSVGASQSVRVGSVANVDTGGNITTQGTATGAVTQSAASGRQQLLVAAVIGGAPSNVNARAVLTGAVSQSSTAFSANEQRIAIGSVEGATGQVTTDATVGASLTQSMTGSANSREQLISITSTESTQGTVTTRALINGSVSQTNGSSQSSNPMSQRVVIGSALNTGALNVRTDVTVSGNLSQTANANARGTQSILIGGVSGL